MLRFSELLDSIDQFVDAVHQPENPSIDKLIRDSWGLHSAQCICWGYIYHASQEFRAIQSALKPQHKINSSTQRNLVTSKLGDIYDIGQTLL